MVFQLSDHVLSILVSMTMTRRESMRKTTIYEKDDNLWPSSCHHFVCFLQ